MFHMFRLALPQKPEPIPPTIPLPQQNQCRSPYLPHSKEIETRILLPQDKYIDVFDDLNQYTSNKTIIHVLDCFNGFGDYLRGSILLAEFAKRYKIHFKMDISRHPLSKYLETETEAIQVTPKLVCFNGGDSDVLLNPLISDFINSKEDNLYITTNLYYNPKLVTADIKEYINHFFTFKSKYYEMAKQFVKMDKYRVLHIRMVDDYFHKEFHLDEKLLIEIIKLQLDENTIVISNNYYIKKKLNKLFGFHFIDNPVVHTVNVDDYNDLEITIMEYILLSNSEYTYCFSYYHHGSGFSEQCSILHNIPYKVVYLPITNTIEDTKLLLLQYENVLHNTFITNTSKPVANLDIHKNHNIAFITLTNTGYIDYTLNCLESLKRAKIKQELQIYCIGIEGYNRLNGLGITCNLIDDEENSNFQTFRKNNWSNVTYYKFEIIYNNLLHHDYVCITDGDIVYEDNTIFDYLLNNIGENDMIIQSEGLDTNDICSGFMFIKSNPLTISLFDPKNVEKHRNEKKWDDQVYINKIKHKIQFQKLPLSLFPTGNYYYTYHPKNPYLIHFNWIVGNEKKHKMIHYNKWFIRPKVNICQYSTDGFGHQIEGMLRLLSLSFNDKATYKYGYRSEYQFEHYNLDTVKLNQYLLEALSHLSDKNLETEPPLQVCYGEQRSFAEIIQQDNDYSNKIYFYDGVNCRIPEKLPANFEKADEIEKSLPKLREMFVNKNQYLPSPSYDNTKINVCCHIRLGDAVGYRILDTENLFKVVRQFQKNHKYRVIIHTDGNVNALASSNTIIYDLNTDVLQVFSDFIFADILIINYSSLSIAAHLLANPKQKVICPTKSSDAFKQRILNKCITSEEFLQYCVSL